MDTGDPIFRGEFPRNRILPSPSPSANLVGIWEGKEDVNSSFNGSIDISFKVFI
jgi:hypothetical protein